MYTYQDFALLWNWPIDLPDFEHVGWTVSVANQRPHLPFALIFEFETRLRKSAILSIKKPIGDVHHPDTTSY
jgi:hypothetical protein